MTLMLLLISAPPPHYIRIQRKKLTPEARSRSAWASTDNDVIICQGMLTWIQLLFAKFVQDAELLM